MFRDYTPVNCPFRRGMFLTHLGLMFHFYTP